MLIVKFNAVLWESNCTIELNMLANFQFFSMNLNGMFTLS